MEHSFQHVRKRTWMVVLLCITCILLILASHGSAASISSFCALNGDIPLEYHSLKIFVSGGADVDDINDQVYLHPVSSEAYPVFTITRKQLERRLDFEDHQVLDQLLSDALETLPLPGTPSLGKTESTDLSGSECQYVSWETWISREDALDMEIETGQVLQSQRFAGTTFMVPWKKEVYFLHFITYASDRNNYQLEDLITGISLDGSETLEMDNTLEEMTESSQ